MKKERAAIHSSIKNANKQTAGQRELTERKQEESFGSYGPRFESGRGRCVESLDKALYSHCPKEKPSH